MLNAMLYLTTGQSDRRRRILLLTLLTFAALC